MGSVINNRKLTNGTTYAVASKGVTVSGMVKTYKTYADMLADTEPASFGFVIDATGDASVNKGFAIYFYSAGTWKKLFEEECMDAEKGLTIKWENVVGKPEATPAAIDNAAEKAHSHDNTDTLNDLSTSEDGQLLFRGEPISVKVDSLFLQLVRPVTMNEPVHLKLEFFSDENLTDIVAVRNSSSATDASKMYYTENGVFNPVNSSTGIPVSCQGRFVIAKYPESLDPLKPAFIRYTWIGKESGTSETGIFATPSTTPSNSESIGLVFKPL